MILRLWIGLLLIWFLSTKRVQLHFFQVRRVSDWSSRLSPTSQHQHHPHCPNTFFATRRNRRRFRDSLQFSRWYYRIFHRNMSSMCIPDVRITQPHCYWLLSRTYSHQYQGSVHLKGHFPDTFTHIHILSSLFACRHATVFYVFVFVPYYSKYSQPCLLLHKSFISRPHLISKIIPRKDYSRIYNWGTKNVLYRNAFKHA